MGIRFRCPNGHKLNVKTFQAGKRGICPYCGVKFTVPSESTQEVPESTDETAEPQREDAPPLEQPSVELPPAEEPRAEEPRTEEPRTEQPRVETPKAEHSRKKKVEADPLVEDPQAVWYVRPPSGGQFGPADADVMRTWIKEGRVTADSLVWREGWRDWTEAVSVFPKLALRRWLPSDDVATVPPPPPVDKLKLDVKTEIPKTKADGRIARKLAGGRGKKLSAREKKDQQIIIVVVLSVVAVALACVLVWVLMR